MPYKSTRSNEIEVHASFAVLNGLAEDGGLYMRKDFDKLQIDLRSFQHFSYQEMAESILCAYLDDYPKEVIHECVQKAYVHKFDTEEIVPLVKLKNTYILELFHGPTSAFKDVALSILPHLIQGALKIQNTQDEIIILTATSGDTGKAALEGFKDVEQTQIFVFYPNEKVSTIQKAQMVTQTGHNVHVAAVEGNFDDCQSAVKKILTDETINAEMKNKRLSSANSINIGRLIPQIVYYFKAYMDLVNQQEIEMYEKVNFAVPTGNFGNILAGYLAKKMGLPIDRLICASNENNVLTDFIQTGIYNANRSFKTTISPSMDILISSNLERLIYLLCEGNSAMVKNYMDELSLKGSYEVCDLMKKKLQKEFFSGYASDEQTERIIQEVFEKEAYLMDPHTAVAYKVFQDFQNVQLNDHKTVILATASPYKFTHAVMESLHQDAAQDEFELMKQLHEVTQVSIPENLKDLDKKVIQHKDVIHPDEIKNYILEKLGE